MIPHQTLQSPWKTFSRRMTAVRCQVNLVVLIFLGILSGGDSEVCVVNQSCVLPCSFERSDEVVIHWILLTDINVHSYYYNKDQLELQNRRFQHRTSLFKNEISRGNASLQLTKVEVKDRGKYKCYTSTILGNKESFIDVEVEAPVREVRIQQIENRISCSSEGIYPEPVLTWNTTTPSNVTATDKPTVRQTEQQLYTISGSLIPSDTSEDVGYSCTVSTKTSQRRATLFKTSFLNSSANETTIHCGASNFSLQDLIWTFNHTVVILKKNRVSLTVSQGWKQQVKLVSESGSLTLTDLSLNHSGIYTCVLSNGDETSVRNTYLRHISQDKPNVAAIVGGTLAALVLVIIGVVFVLCCKKKKKRPTNSRRNTGNKGDII